MQKRHRARGGGAVVGLLTALALVALLGPVAGADQPAALVGSWYGERAQSGQIAGKAFNHRRWLMVHRADGTARDTHRYYLDGQLQGEALEEYQWGVDKGTYWTVCRSHTLNGTARACADRTEYEVQSTAAREFRYRHAKSGVAYSVVRVPEEFRLP